LLFHCFRALTQIIYWEDDGVETCISWEDGGVETCISWEDGGVERPVSTGKMEE
jgi:hypothetical protein